MSQEHLAFLTLGILVIAFLYSSVGHAGSSGYIAVMSLVGTGPAVIKPMALSLNIMVALIGAIQFYTAGHLKWNLFWPFAVLSIPCAFLGGYLNLPGAVFEVLVGCVLLVSAVKFMLKPRENTESTQPALWLALLAGAALGFLAGLTGTGGGIFLTPLLIIAGWAKTKTAAAVSALFILVNSIAGLVGHMGATSEFPAFALFPVIAALVGGLLGSFLGSRRFPQTTVQRLLAVVLTIAGLKLILVWG